MFDYYPDRSSLILVNFGSRGVTTVAALLLGCAIDAMRALTHWGCGSVGQSELGAVASHKAIRWDLHLASLLTHFVCLLACLFVFVCLFVCTVTDF